MTIDNILEQDNIRAISEKTRISILNVERLVNKDFSKLKRVQVLGFISILEREYGCVLDDLREASNQYFNSLNEIPPLPVQIANEDKTSSNSSWLTLVLGLVVLGALWLFYNTINQNQTQPAVAQVTEELNATIEPIVIETNKTDVNSPEASITDANSTTNTNENNSSIAIDNNATATTSVKIVPVKRLWFATYDISTKKITNKTMTQPYDVNSSGDTLIATSVAPFALHSSAGEKKYSDFKAHYFKITSSGANEITKEQFISNGGPASLAK